MDYDKFKAHQGAAGDGMVIFCSIHRGVLPLVIVFLIKYNLCGFELQSAGECDTLLTVSQVRNADFAAASA